MPGVATVRADLSDLDAIRPAFDDQDTVVHLAAKAGDRHSWEALRDTNVIGTRNVLEAARRAGCKRVVFASSGATVAGWEREEPYRAMVATPTCRRTTGRGFAMTWPPARTALTRAPRSGANPWHATMRTASICP